MLAPLIFGVLTLMAIAEDNTSSNKIYMASLQAEVDHKPAAIVEPKTTLVPLLSLIWVALSIFGIIFFLYLVFKTSNPPKFLIVLVLLNILAHCLPLRWYPPPLKDDFISNLHKYINIVPKKVASP